MIWTVYQGQAKPSGLLERADELAQLQAAVAATGTRTPGAILIEGPAGIGKTALVTAVCAQAAQAGLQVLTASGSELERELGLGVARQLFEPLLAQATSAELSELLDQQASRVARLFGLESSGADHLAGQDGSQNALYWLTARLAKRSPTLVAVDDLHWADSTSLRWIAYLTRRLEDLPILLVLARRLDEPDVDAYLLRRIAAEPAVVAIRPPPLSVDAVRQLVRDGYGAEPQAAFVRACHRAAGGNPLYTLQLLDAARAGGLRPIDLDADAVAGLAPERVSEFVLDRLGHLSAAAISVAERVALLGADAEVRHVRALSGLALGDVLEAGDELAAAGLLKASQPYEFVHPIIRASVYESIPAGRRAAIHARAARLVSRDGASPARIAIHLLRAPAAGDSWVAGVLRAAAAAEVRPETRANYLRRAIAEPVPTGERAEVLTELGRAESLTYDAAAIEHLSEALRLSDEPSARAVATALLAYCLVEHDRGDEAEPILRAAIDGLSGTRSEPGGPDDEARLALQVALLEAEQLTSSLTQARLDEAVAMASAGESPAELDLLSMAAMVAPAAGASCAHVIALAERALLGADLSTLDGFRLIHCPVWGLESADRLDEADRWFARIQDAAQRWDSPTQFMLASSARAEVSVRRGALADAERDARAALELAQEHGRDYGMSVSLAALVMALTEQGRLAEADAALSQSDPGRGSKCDYAIYVLSRGRLRLAQGDPATALDELAACGRLTRETGHDFPGFWPWRTSVCAALMALDRLDDARDIAEEEVRLVQPFGAPGPIGVALRTLGTTERGSRRIDLLAAACEELRRSPALLERARAYLELGAALRRNGRRADSREPLRKALDLADRCGAGPLARRARQELAAAGARPRRTRIGGVDALTSSELRVALIAAHGRTNREIAGELFVTVKAVEKHLASTYRKLGIQGRAELADALRPSGRGEPPAPPGRRESTAPPGR